MFNITSDFSVSKINILFIGDVVGEPGLKALKDYLPNFIQKYEPHLVIVNGENACDGKSITDKEAEQIFILGADVITSGNHVWDNWKSRPLLASNPKVLRPYNYPQGNVGRGYAMHQLEDGTEICVLNIQGRTFMQTIDCPFKAADAVLKVVADKTKIIIVDFHAEASAEKIAMGWYLDGRVSAVIGTHTHIQTADATILSEGTAFITDSGMTGPYNSVVGLKKDIAIKRFTMQTPFKYEMASGDERICGVYVSVDSETGRATKIESFMHPAPVKEVRQ